VEIELASVGEAATVADLWVDLAAQQRQYGSHLRPEANAAGIRDDLARRAATDGLLVAREDGIVGFVAFSLDRGGHERDVARGVIENIFVVSDRRDEGIGSELLRAAERSLRESGADVIALEAMSDNEAARRFYRRHGFDPHRVTYEKPLESDNHSKEGG
jgi:ribosomal protein S18 acetylase RimI-like enzyme